MIRPKKDCWWVYFTEIVTSFDLQVADEEGLVEKAQKEERRVTGLTKADPGGPPISCGQPEGNIKCQFWSIFVKKMRAMYVVDSKDF